MKAYTLIVKTSYKTLPDDETIFLVAANNMQDAIKKLNEYIYKSIFLFRKSRIIPCKELKKDFESYEKNYFWTIN